jgi:hypothetical protein
MIKHLKKFVKLIPFVGDFLRRNYMQILRLLPRSLVLMLCRPNVDWNKIDTEVNDYLTGNDYGITTEKRNPKVIVSLTSYPARIPRIHYTIISLLKQTIKPDEIILWLGNEQFHNKNDDLPKELLKLQDHGLTIKYCKDIRSYKKLIPALHEYPEDIIVTADDDAVYKETWLKKLVDSYKQDKTSIHCHSAHRITLKQDGVPHNYLDWLGDYYNDQEKQGNNLNLQRGTFGVLYPPHTLYKDILNEDLFMKLSPQGDDLWFWTMATLSGTKICVVKDRDCLSVDLSALTYESIMGLEGLRSINVYQDYNDVQIKQIFDYYPQLCSILTSKAM